jgi:hypothetical protein
MTKCFWSKIEKLLGWKFDYAKYQQNNITAAWLYFPKMQWKTE